MNFLKLWMYCHCHCHYHQRMHSPMAWSVDIHVCNGDGDGPWKDETGKVWSPLTACVCVQHVASRCTCCVFMLDGTMNAVFDGLGNTHPLWLFDEHVESKIWEPPKIRGERAPLSPRILGTLPDFTDSVQTGIWVENKICVGSTGDCVDSKKIKGWKTKSVHRFWVQILTLRQKAIVREEFLL